MSLLVIDEAARVEDNLYASVRPMLAISKGSLVALASPFGMRGWYYDSWKGAAPWHRIKITADQCPRIAKEFLEEERKAIGANGGTTKNMSVRSSLLLVRCSLVPTLTRPLCLLFKLWSSQHDLY